MNPQSRAANICNVAALAQLAPICKDVQVYRFVYSTGLKNSNVVMGNQRQSTGAYYLFVPNVDYFYNDRCGPFN